MKQIFSRVLLLIIVTAAILGLSSCTIFFEQEEDIYRFDSSRFDREVVLGEELDLDSLSIEVFGSDGVKKKTLTVTESMVVKGDTSTIGDQELVIEYGGERWTVMYTVFYEIKFTVPDDPTQSSTQLVSSVDEIIVPDDPTMSGSTFIGWSKKIPAELTGNMELFAIFADRITIPKFEATYGDKLSSLDLPEVNDAKWEWVDDPDTTYVGNATEGRSPNSFQILYIPDNDELDPIEFTTTVSVKKKALTFSVPTSVEYDPDAQKYNFLGMYTLTGFIEGQEDYKPRVILLGDNNVSEIGKYSYTLGVADSNYSGNYVGYFEITPIKLTIDVLWKSGKDVETIIYGGQLPEYEYKVKDKDGNEYTEFLSSDLKVTVHTPALEVGTYYLNATLSDEVADDIDYTQYYSVNVNYAKLIVESKVMNPGDPKLAEEYVIYFGDTLSEIQFAYHPNGSWAWVDDPSTTVGNVGTNRFKAQFTPFSDNYDAPEPVWISLTVLPKELSFRIISSTRVIYDGKPHNLTYEIIDLETGEKFDKELVVLGNESFTDASDKPYSITLTFEDTNYLAKNNSFNITIDKASPEIASPSISGTWKPGMKVSDLDISGVENDGLAGVFTWNNGGQPVDMPGNYEYSATFTPSDSNNYSPVTVKVLASVDKATPKFESDVTEYTGLKFNDADYALKNVISTTSDNSKGNVKFLLSDGTEITSLKNAGTYTVTVIVEADREGYYKEIRKTVTVTIDKVDPVISLDIDNWTYGSAAKQPVADCDAIGSYEIGIAGYEYRLVGSSEWLDFTSASYPTKAGKYELRALVAEGANHNSGVSETVSFTIDKQVVTVPTIASMTYNKGTQYPAINSTSLYTVATKGTSGNMGGENVGKYYVTLTLVDGDNYKWPGTESLTYEAPYDITKAMVNVIADFNGGEWTYNGTAQVDHSTTSDFGEVKFTYYYITETDRILVEKDAIVNAGDYLVVASVDGNNNYVAATSVEKSFTIKKAVVSRPVLNSDSFEFNGQLIKPTIVDNNATNKALYYVSRNTGNTNVGEKYEVVLTIDPSKFNNYRWEGQADDQSTLTLTYDITQAVVNIESANQSGWTYLDSTILPVIKINKSFSVNYKYEYRLAGTENWTEIAPTNAGNYEVRVTVLDDASGNANYVGGEDKSKVLTFAIAPKSYDLNVTVNGGTYNKTDLTSGLSGVAGIYTVTDSGDAATVAGKGTAAGTYTVTFTLVPTTDGVYNYVWGTLPAGAVKSSDGSTVTISYTIEQKSVAKPTFIANSFTYALENGAAKDYAVTAAQLNNFNSEYMTITCDKQNQAGNYTATVTLDSNYKWDDNDTSRTATVNWSINKAKAEIIVDTTTITVTYGQTVALPTANTNFGTVSCDKVASDLVNKGEYTVTYTVAGTDNYDGDTKTLQVVINKATVTVSEIEINGWTYDRYDSTKNKPTFTSAKTNTGVDVSGYVTFEYSENGIDGWTTDVPENAGTYYLRAKISTSKDGNWDETYVNASETFKIAKQGIAAPDIDDLTYNGTLQYPDISNKDGWYTVALQGTDGNKGIENVGSQFVTLTLTDEKFKNYKWEDEDETEQSTDVYYNVTKATPSIYPGFDKNEDGGYGKTYDGKNLAFNPTAHAGEYEITTGINIKYYQYILKDGKYEYDEIAPPTNVGTYYIRVTVAAGENWNANNTDYIKYVISPDEIRAPELTGSSEYYYDNIAKYPVISTSDGYTIKWYEIKTENGETVEDLITDKETIIHTGKYKVVISLNDAKNYVWSDTKTNAPKSFEYEIKQNTVSVTDIIFKNGETTLANTWVFGTNVTVGQTVDKTFDDITFTYKYEYKLSSESDDKYVEWTEASYPKNVGEYSIRVTVNGNENYAGVSRVETVTITQATETPTVSTPEDFASKPGNPEFVQGDSETNDKLVLDYIPGNTAFDVEEYLTVTLDTENVVESNREIDRIVITKNSSAYSMRAATVTGTLDSVGEYTVTYYFKTNDNYTDASVTITVIIKAKSIADVIDGETTKPAVNVNFGYDSAVFNNNFQEQSISITTAEGGVLLAENTDFTWTIKNSDGDIVNADEIKHAGTYTVVITGTGNYTGSVTRTFTVTKKQVSISTVIDTVNLVEYKKDTKYSLEDLINPSITEVSNATFEYYVDGSNDTSTHLENAGTFSVKVVLVHDDYKAEATVSATVKKNTSDTGTPSNKPATYGDKLFSVVGALPDHTEYGTWSWENADENTTVGPAGENTFYAVFTPHAEYAGNYDSRRVPVIITVSKSGNVRIDTNVNYGQQYNGEAGYEIKDLINPSVDGIENETFTYYLIESIDGVNVETVVTKLTDAKTYRIKVVLVHANFEAETYVDVTINPNTTATGTVNVKNEATFLDKLSSLGSLPTSEYGTWAWADADKNEIPDHTLVTVGNATADGEHNIFYAIFTPYAQYEANYAKREVKIEVSVGKYEITKPDDITENYTGSDVISSHFESHEHYSLFDVTYEDDERVNVGEYTATLTLNDDAFKNYKWKNTDDQSVTVSYKISESAIQWTITGLDGWTFGDPVDEYTAVAKYGETAFGYKVEYKLEGEEYTEWTDSSYPDKAGTYTVRFTAIADDIGSYENTSVTREITVSPRSVSGATVTLNKNSEIYTGSNFASSISVNSVKLVVNGEEKTLVAGTDYTVSIPESIINVGEYTITVSGKGNYSGTVSETFTVSVREISTPSVTGGNSFVFNTEAQHPTIEPSDYYIIKWYKIVGGNYEEITSALENSSIGVGSYVAVVTLNDAHNATHTNIKWAADATTSFGYSITPKDIGDKTGEEFDITIDHTYNSLIYTGNPVTDKTVTVKWGNTTLGSDDCDITIKNEKGETAVLNAGTYTITVTGKGNYEGTRSEVTFIVDEKSINGATVSLGTGDLTDGKYVVTYANKNFIGDITFAGIELSGYTDVTLVKDENSKVIFTFTDVNDNPVTEIKNAGTYYVIVTGTGNFEGTAKAEFEVKVREITAPTFTGGNSFVFNGLAQAPTVAHNTVDGNDIYYSTSIPNSINVGSDYAIVVTLDTATHGSNIKWAEGSVTSYDYKITPMDISDIVDGENTTHVVNVVFGNSLTYTGGNQDQTVTVTWQRDVNDPVTLNANNVTDYTWTINGKPAAEAVINSAGTYTVVITGTGNYTGSVERKFEVAKANAEITGTPGNISNVTYDPTKTYLENLFANVDVKYTSGSKNGQTTGLTPTVTVVYDPYVGEKTTTIVENSDTYEIKNAGTYTITYSFANDNFNEVEDVVVTVTIGQATETLTTDYINSEKNQTYGNKLPTTLPTLTNGTWAWATGKDADGNWIFATSETTVGNVTAADEYNTFTAVFTPGEGYENNYKTNSVDVDFTVSKATPNVSVIVDESKTYDGDKMSVEVNVVVPAVPNSDTTTKLNYTVYYYLKNAEGNYNLYGTDAPSNAGDYAIRVVVEQSLYWESYDNIDKDGNVTKYDATFSITAKEVEIDLGSNVENGTLNLTYNDGTPFDLTNELGARFVDAKENVIKDGIKYYMMVDGVLTEVTSGYITNHGEYTVTIKLDNANYTVTNTDQLTITVKVAKKGIDLPEYVENLDYNGKNQTPTITHNSTVVGSIEYKDLYKVTYANDGKNLNVGTYGIYFKLTDEAFANYKWNGYGENEQTVSLTYNINRVDPSVSVEVNDDDNTKPYDGNAMSVTVEVTVPEATLIAGTNYTVYYYVKNAEGNYELYGTAAPTNVGEYAIRVTVTGGEGYNWNARELTDDQYDATFSITKKSITGATVSLGTGDLTDGKYVVTYEKDTDFYSSIIADGKITVTVDGLSATYSVIVATDSEGKNPVNSVKNAGTYYVIVTGTGNFEGTAYATFVVEQATVNLDHITAIGDKTYSNSSQNSGLTSGTGYTVTDSGGTNVDTYTVTFALESDNYKWGTIPSYITDSNEDGIYSMTYNIVAKSLSDGDITIEHTYKNSEGNNLVYTGAELPGTVIVKWGENITLVNGSDKDYTFEITGIDNAGNTVTEVKNAGTYTITITAYENGNYKGSVTREFVVEKQSVTPTWTNPTYNGADQTLTFGNNAGLTEENYIINLVGNDQNNGVGKDAGTYYAYVVLADPDNYKWAEWEEGKEPAGVSITGDTTATITWNIASVDPTVTVEVSNKTFDNSAIVPSVSVTGVTVNGEPETITTGITVYYYVKSGTNYVLCGTDGKTAPTDAGDYAGYVIVEKGTNYNGHNVGAVPTAITAAEADATFKIEQATVNLGSITVSDKTYNGSNQTSGLVNGTGYTVIDAGGTNVGTYTVKFALASANYKWGTKPTNATENGDGTISLTYNITAASITGATVTLGKDSDTYTGSDLAPTVIVKITLNEEELTLTKDTDFTVTIKNSKNETVEEIVDAGTYTISVTGKGNYKDTATMTKTFTVAKALATISGDGQTSGLTYTGSVIPTDGTAIENLTVKDSAGNVIKNLVTLSYTYKHSYESFEKAEALTTPNETQILNAGYYIVTITLTSDNYTAEAETIQVFIGQATPILSADEGYKNNTYYENRLGDADYSSPTLYAKLSNGFEFAGTWEYTVTFNSDDPDNSSAVVKFVPTDSNNCVSGITITLTSLKLKPVARLESLSGTPYGTIENAIAAASVNGTVWVVPDTTGNVIIEKEFYISNGVTLLLPFAYPASDTDDVDPSTGESYINVDSDGRNDDQQATLYVINVNASGNIVEDSTAVRSLYYGTASLMCTNLVKVADGVTIYIDGGYLEISGELSGGGGASDYAGHTARYYAELQLGAGAKIVVNNDASTIKSYGFITESNKGNGSEVTLNAGVLWQPFTLRDFGGGTYMATFASTNNVTLNGSTSSAVGSFVKDYIEDIGEKYGLSAFNEFQFINVHPQLTINYNAEMNAWANLYADSQQNAAEVKIIGNSDDYLVKLTSDQSIFVGKYNKDTGVTDIDVFGGAELRYLSLKVPLKTIDVVGTVGIDINTSNLYFPISWAYDISLNDGNYVFNSDVQLMPGSKLEVAADATLTSAHAIYVHKDMTTISVGPNNVIIYGNETSTAINSAGRTNGAEFIVNGVLSVHTFAGMIKSNTNNAQVTITNITRIEFWKIASYNASDADGNGTKCDMSSTGYAYAVFVNADDSSTYGGAGSVMTYNGSKWMSDDISFILVTDGGSMDGDSISYSEITGSKLSGSSYVVTEDFVTAFGTPTKAYYDFAGWYMYNANEEYVSLSDMIGKTMNVTDFAVYIYAEWTPKTYYVKYENATSDKDENGDVLTLPDLPEASGLLTEFTVGTNTTIPSPKNGNGWYFLGWYLDAAFTKKVVNYSEVTKTDGQTTTLYARWTNKETYVITVNDSMGKITSVNVTKEEYDSGTITSLLDAASAYLNNPGEQYYVMGWLNSNNDPIKNWSDVAIENNATVTITVVWGQKYYVDFSGSNGISGTNAITFDNATDGYYTPDEIKEFMIGNLSVASKWDDDPSVKMYFKGWTFGNNAYYTDETSIEGIDFTEIDVNSTMTLNLEAAFAQKVQVTIDYSNGHTLCDSNGDAILIVGGNSNEETVWIKPGGTYSINTEYVSTLKTGDDDVNISHYYGGFTSSVTGIVDGSVDEPTIEISDGYSGGDITVSVVWKTKHAINWSISGVDPSTSLTNWSPDGYKSATITIGDCFTITVNNKDNNGSGTCYVKPTTPTSTITISATATGCYAKYRYEVNAYINVNGNTGTTSQGSTVTKDATISIVEGGTTSISVSLAS